MFASLTDGDLHSPALREMVVLRRSEVKIRYFPMLATLDAYQFYVSVGLETASLLIATVGAVP